MCFVKDMKYSKEFLTQSVSSVLYALYMCSIQEIVRGLSFLLRVRMVV